MSARIAVLAAVGVSFLAAAAAGAQVVSIPGLFTTGVDALGTPLPGGAADPHYTVYNGSTLLGPAYVMTGIPGSYVPNDATSQWVWETASGQPTNVTRTFRTTFDLTGYDPSTALLSGMWAVDNTGLDILINGVSTGNTAAGFGTFYAFSITSGFVSGVNTLDFVANDFGVISGFRVGAISGRVSVLQTVPEPTTFVLVGSAIGIVGLIRRRRRGS